jgi:protein NEDD1
MLSVATANGLALFDPAAIKRSSPSPTSSLSLTSTTNAAVWSADNTRLFIASGNDIRTHQPGSSRAEVLYSHPTTISNILVQNKKSLVFAAGEHIYALDYDGKASSTPKTFASMKSPINSLSLSNDSSLLSATTLDSVHVYETATGSHTTLRGSALIGLQIHTAAFHRETRTKLLLGANRQLLVYDITKPLGPIRTIQINDPTSGDIIGITCSPFSKNLVAFCTAKGYVGLVDLEKDKG